MAIDDLRLAVRRHSVAIAAILLAATALAAVRLADRPPSSPIASTTIAILPDPRAPISSATPVLPAYQTFGTKVGSIETRAVLRRAAQIALGERPFTSPELIAEHLAPRIEAGIAGARSRIAEGEEIADAVEELAGELGRRLSVKPIPRKQIVEIRVEGGSPAEAAFLSWAVAEAAHQHHGERMRREGSAIRARLSVEIERARAELSVEKERESARPAPTAGELEVRGRLLAALAGRLGQDEVRLRIAFARNRLGIPADGFDPITASSAFRQERHFLVLALESARFELLVRSTVLSATHPEMVRDEAAVMRLAGRIASLDAARSAIGERRRIAALRKDRFELALERSALEDRREWLARETEAWQRSVAAATGAREATESLHERIASLTALDRRVHWFAEGLGSPIVLLGPAMGSTLPPPPLPPGALLLTLALIFVAALLAAAVGIERMRDVLRGRRDVEDRLGVPLLGVIPEARARSSASDPYESGATPGFEPLAASLVDGADALSRRVIAVASAEAGEGRTTVAIALAAALARRGRRVVIIDGDLRAPALGQVLGLPPGQGLLPCLIGAGEDVPVVGELFGTAIPNLDALTGEALAADDLAILSPPRLRELLGTLADAYDHVIVDTPSLAWAGDALVIGGAVDGVLLVAASHRTARARVAEARRLLEAAGGSVLGVVLAGFPHTPAAAFSLRAEGSAPPTPSSRVRSSALA